MSPTLAPEAAIIPLPHRMDSPYSPAAQCFLAAGIPSSVLRERAVEEPRFAELFLGTADAMDVLSTAEWAPS